MSLKLHPHHRLLTMICLGFTAVVVFLSLTNGQFDRMEQAGRDWLMTNGAARRAPQDPRIVFLGIDEATRQLDDVFADELEKSSTLRLMKHGFPWNREVYADIIDRLATAGAKAVVFDLVFPSEREGDEAFHAALDKHRNLVVIGSNLVHKAQEDVDQSVYTASLQNVFPSLTVLVADPHDPRIGFVNVQPDPDRIVRHVLYRTTLQEFFNESTPGGSEELLSLAASGLMQAGLTERIPPGRRAVMFRYAEDFQPRSLHEIFIEANWNAPPYNQGALFRDKIVLIGAMGQASEDRLQTPFGTTLASLIQLNAINAALQGDFITESRTRINVGLVVTAGALAWLLGAGIRRPLVRLLVLALSAGGYLQSAQWIANDFGLLVVLVGPLFTFVASGITWSAWEQVLDHFERQRTRRALERYVGHDVAHEVLDNPQTYFNALGGVRKEIAVLFSDVRGFTTLTETADPHALVAQLNEYFTEMVAIVFAHQGTLDKFIGDAVMATWGSIVGANPATNAANAVITALEMREALVRLNAGWKQRGIMEWKIGIGINHGEPITGNIGAAGKFERFDLTVVGDAVNLASRLEGVTKQYHIDLCIGESVAELVRDQFVLRSVDSIIVKGKTRPVEIFTVLGKVGEPEPPWLASHEDALRLYRAGEFALAEKAWREILAQERGDGLATVFIERCVELQTNPPAEPWTGVYEMKSK